MSPIAPALDRAGRPLFEDAAGDIAVSFEFFPPKTERMEQVLWESVKTLEPLGPRFVSVTYGAGGSTRERTHATVVRIQRDGSVARGHSQALAERRVARGARARRTLGTLVRIGAREFAGLRSRCAELAVHCSARTGAASCARGGVTIATAILIVEPFHL
jgi:hypothetical protein